MSDVLSTYFAKKKDKKVIAEIQDAEDIVESKRSVHSRLLLTRLAELRDNYQLCDVALVVKGARINAHRVVLAASSNYFRAMFTNDMAESRMSMFASCNIHF
ncbi:hypothetical protein TELCIR_08192 [Teladorsagia circumcincta]|uniref:BTB domain-containing protein n=1 Tax=Teladorsagia circumcincta TaxID=45464 RepID=A0A2G9UI86_TELCI|nr:hypothetical protein TELCIR_08192 [Teladorsagia circumcincta]